MKLRPTHLVLVVAGILAVGVLLQARTSRTETYSTANPYGSQGQAEANPGTYAAEYSGPDHLTTNGNNLKVTKAWANPIQSKDEGAIEWTQTNGTEVVFDGRTAGNGCLYDVEGVYLGPGPGNAIWHSAFDNRSTSQPRILLEVNNDGPDDNYIAVGDNTGTLKVILADGISGTTYNVQLTSTGNGDPAGDVGFAPNPVSVSNDSPAIVSLSGLAVGRVKITAKTTEDSPSAAEGAVDATVVGTPTIQVRAKKSSSPDSYGSSAAICAGGINSNAHTAEVLVTTDPATPNLPITVSMTGGDGVDVAAALDIGSTTDSSGQLSGTLISSDMLESVTLSVTIASISSSASSSPATVQFEWDDYTGDDAWVSETNSIIPGGTSSETVKLMHGDTPIDGHKLQFYIGAVEYIDEDGNVATITNDPNDPVDMSEWASFDNAQPTTGSDGTATVTLSMADRDDVLSISLYYYDLTVWNKE